jgi:nuclear migration protein JNM1
VEFSDRVDSKRRSYIASSRRRRRLEDGTEELGDLSDEEDETLQRKLARLHREAEELRDEISRRQSGIDKVTDTDPDNVNTGAIYDDVESLSRMLDGISTSAKGSRMGAYAELAKMLSMTPEAASSTPNKGLADQQPATKAIPTPPHQQSHALAKAADFDSRLTALEKALGIGSSSLFSLDQGPTKAVIPTLDTLDKQISTLSSLSPASLDKVSQNVRQLTLETEKLDEARKSAKAAQGDLVSSPTTPQAADGRLKSTVILENPEHVSKVNALYSTLATIENLSPLLPLILERLRTLRTIHANAATAYQTMEDVEKRQQEMAAEIKLWKEGLEEVEETVKEGEATMGSNMRAVEGWVKDLETRAERLTY